MRASVKEMEKEEKFPAEAIKKLGELGCCGMLVPEEGGPIDTVSYAPMLGKWRACSRRCLPRWRDEFGGTSAAVGFEPPRRRKIFAAHGNGKPWRFFLTELAAGSDATGIQARAVRVGECYA